MGSIMSMQWPISDARRARQYPAALLVLSGALHQARGRISVIRGTRSQNDILRAYGHRQQLVGMLQRFWKRDRKSIETWVDALLRRGTLPALATRPALASRTAWRARPATSLLRQER